MTRPQDSIQPRELLEEVGWVYRLARHLLVDEDQAEDAIQETWVAALESPPRDRRNIRAWLATALRNVVRKKRRTETARRRREQRRGSQAPFPPPEEVVERAEIHRGVVEAVLGLEEPYQTTILYRFFEDRSAGEIAAHFGVPVSTVRTRLQRGLQRLRARLDRAYGDDRQSWCLALTVFARSSSPPVGAGAASVNAAIGKSLLGWRVAAPIVLALAVVGTVLIATRNGEPEPAFIPRTDPSARRTTADARRPAAVDRSPAPVATGRNVPSRLPVSARPSETPSWYRFVSGTVRDDVGAPRAGAVVRALLNRPPFDLEMKELAKTRTNEKGVYRLGPVTDVEQGLFVEASMAGRFADREWTFAGTRRDFSLGRPGGLTGRVVLASDRSPCPDATVAVYLRSRYDPFDSGAGWRTDTRWWAPHAETRTDGEGRYRFRRLPPGEYDIMAFPLRHHRKGAGPLTVVAGRETVKDLHVAPGDVLWGVITDARTNAPIPGAQVIGRNARHRATANALGVYRLPGIIPDEPLTLLIGAEGYVWQHCVLAAGHRTAMHQDFPLSRAGLLRGRVLGPDGDGLAGANVAVEWTSLPPETTRRVETDDDGRFVLENACRSDLRLRVRAHGLAALLSDWIRVLPNQVVADVVLQLKRGGSLGGRVALPDGRPAAWAMVQLVATEGTCTSVFAADDGRYRVRRVHPGVYEVNVVPRGAYAGYRSAFCRQRQKGIRIADGVVLELDFVLREGTALEGEVVDDGGRPLADVPVYAGPDKPAVRLTRTGGDLDMRRTYTDAGGRFRIVGLPNDGLYTVFAYGNPRGNANTLRRKVRPEAGPLRLTMRRALMVSGRVVRADGGRPAPSFWIEAHRIAPDSLTSTECLGKWCFTHPDGRFQLGIEHRICQLAAGTPDGLISEPRLLDCLREAPEARIDFVVHPAATLKGAVVNPKGRPGIGIVTLYRLSSTHAVLLRSARTDSRGRFEIGSLPPGRYFLGSARLTHPRWVAGRVVSLSPGGLAEVLLQYEIAGELRVSVRDPDGRPVSGARVTLRHEDGRPAILETQRYRLEIDRRFYPNPTPEDDRAAFFRSFQVTDESGAVHPRYPAAGRYVVEAAASGCPLKETTAVVQSGAVTQVKIALEKK